MRIFQEKVILGYHRKLIKSPDILISLGRGVIASKDIKKGTLLAVSKAFASGYQQDAVQPLMSINMISNKADGIANKLQMIRAVDNLRKNPQMTREVYSLYAGDLPLDEEISEGLFILTIYSSRNLYQNFPMKL